MANTSPTSTPSGKIKRDGPEAQALVRYLLDHTDRVLSIGEVAAATGAPHSYTGRVLNTLAKHTYKGTTPDVRIMRPLTGMVKRVGIGAYYVDSKATDRLVSPDVLAAPAADATGHLEAGHLLEVIRTYDNGRVILACEQGYLFTGTLTRVDA